MTKNKEIYYLERLIMANKTLYYNGFAITDDIEYDELENRLKKIDPTNWLLDFPGWNSTWIKNNGYRLK